MSSAVHQKGGDQPCLLYIFLVEFSLYRHEDLPGLRKRFFGEIEEADAVGEQFYGEIAVGEVAVRIGADNQRIPGDADRRIGRLNRSQKWKDVVAAFCLGAGTEQIAKMTLDAAADGFNYEKLSNDNAYQKAVELLVHLGIAARSGDFIGHMRDCGIDLSDTPSIQELTAKLGEKIDEAAWENYSTKTDLGEYAKLALCSAVCFCAEKESAQVIPGLLPRFDVGVFNSFGKKVNFSELNQRFISQVTARGLNAYLAQIIPNLSGVEQRVSSIHEISAAYKSLEKYCYETARVHRDYANEWLGRHNYQLEDINADTIKKHANFMVMKMLRALKYGKD